VGVAVGGFGVDVGGIGFGVDVADGDAGTGVAASCAAVHPAKSTMSKTAPTI